MSSLEGQRQTENTSAEQEQRETEEDRYFKWAELLRPQHSWGADAPFVLTRHKTSRCASESATGSREYSFSTSQVRFGFGQTHHFLTFFPLTAFLEKFNALKTLHNVAFCGNGAGTFQAAMLRHGFGKS